MVAAYPLLNGFETEPRKILDLCFSSYLLTDASQSNEFKGDVISLPKRIQLFNGIEDILVEEIRLDLEKIYSRYFEQIDVNVRYKGIDETPEHTVDIYIAVTVVRDGITYDLARTVNVVDSKTFNVVNTLNQ